MKLSYLLPCHFDDTNKGNNISLFHDFTLMLLVANLAITKLCKNPEKLLKSWQMGTHLRMLSKSFPMSTNMTGF